MQTNFSLAQLADPDVAVANDILRACVHCGFCQATCPTYVLLGDELDSPRGRIYLIKEMLENDRPATEEVVTHLGRISGLPPTVAKERAAESLRHVGLHEERYRLIGTSSTGMKQRAKLAQAL